ncbi:MAG: primosomal protein DnaI [Sporolactobacillus sp.]
MENDPTSDPFQAVMNRLGKPPGGLASTQEIISKLWGNPRIQRLFADHPSIGREEWLKHTAKLYQYAEEWRACDQCPGLEHCPNMLRGYRPLLVNDHGRPALSFTACPLTKERQVRQRQSQLIRSYYVPKDILQASFKTIDTAEPSRQMALKAAGEFVTNYLTDSQTVKGLYLCGEFGVGKTYLMGAIMHALAEKRHIASLIVYVPDFFHEIKSAIQDNSVDQKLDVLKKTPVLILDDIGAETITPWIRDEVLGSILQYRMMEHLPTLYTSNFNYDELEEHFTYSQKSGAETVKAGRLMERIRHFTQFVQMGGANRR